jgi:hypothetical protein
VHGGRGEALIGEGEMEGEGDKGKKEEALDPIMMDEDQIKRIMETTGKTRSGVPYQYKLKTKKRVIAMREGLASDEEEVEDLQDVEKIEEILRVTYERKTRGPREEIEGNTPIHISVSVELINPCVTNTPRKTPPFRQPNFGRRQHEVHLNKEKKLGEPVKEELVKYLHHVEAVVQNSGWQDMIPPLGYQNSKDRHRRTQRSTCLSVKIFGK